MTDTSELTAAEQAYFESRGEADPAGGHHEPPPASAPAPAAEAGADIDPSHRAERDERRVPYGALAEERARRKELQRQLGEMRERHEEVLSRLQGQVPSDENASASSGEVPSPDGASETPTSEGVDPQDEAAPGDLGQIPEDIANAVARRDFANAVRAYKAQQPDFTDAYHFALRDRARELVDLGFLPSEAMRITNRNEMEIVERALALGRDPAQVIYDHALRRGYRRAEIQLAPVRSQPPALSETDRVVIAARGQAGAKSLSSAGGGASGTLSLEALAGMSDDEFAAATRGDRWEKLMG